MKIYDRDIIQKQLEQIYTYNIYDTVPTYIERKKVLITNLSQLHFIFLNIILQKSITKIGEMVLLNGQMLLKRFLNIMVIISRIFQKLLGIMI